MSWRQGKRCWQGKIRYDEAGARHALREVKAHSRDNKKIVNRLCAYVCPFCGHWHVGHDRLKGKATPL